jgi:uncharacterized protein DUF6891
VAIGSLRRAGRLAQLKTFAAVQLRSGYRSDDDVRADVLEAVRDEVRDAAEARRLTDEYLSLARAAWLDEAAGWDDETDVDRLWAALDDLEDADIVVLEAVDDHWAADAVLADREAAGRPPAGLVYFTHTDVWHAVEHGMLEINLWHGSRANVTDSDQLLTQTIEILERHDIPATFDEGRIETTVKWQRRPHSTR